VTPEKVSEKKGYDYNYQDVLCERKQHGVEIVDNIFHNVTPFDLKNSAGVMRVSAFR
jgi:hypothetical protein